MTGPAVPLELRRDLAALLAEALWADLQAHPLDRELAESTDGIPEDSARSSAGGKP